MRLLATICSATLVLGAGANASEGGRVAMGMLGGSDSSEAFWDHASAPNDAAVEQLIQFANRRQALLTRATSEPIDPTSRTRLIAESIEALRQARRLAPENNLALGALANMLELAGDGRGAIEAYQRVVQTSTNESQKMAANLAIGRIYLASGNVSEALGYLYAGINQTSGWQVDAQLIYISALCEAGQLADAVDVLAPMLTRSGNNVVALALAAVYDRDEQLSRTYEVLTKAGLSDRSNLVQNIAQLDFVSPERQYLVAFAYEIAGQLENARAAWLAYIGYGPSARYAGRAAQHVAELERLAKEALDAQASVRAATTRPPPPRPPRPVRPSRP